MSWQMPSKPAILTTNRAPHIILQGPGRLSIRPFLFLPIPRRLSCRKQCKILAFDFQNSSIVQSKLHLQTEASCHGIRASRCGLSTGQSHPVPIVHRFAGEIATPIRRMYSIIISCLLVISRTNIAGT